jgi:hypothetical protein
LKKVKLCVSIFALLAATEGLSYMVLPGPRRAEVFKVEMFKSN